MPHVVQAHFSTFIEFLVLKDIHIYNIDHGDIEMLRSLLSESFF
jgi:hypothetical protein